MSGRVEAGQAPAVISLPVVLVRAPAEWAALMVAVEGPWLVPCRDAEPETWWEPASEEAAAAACRAGCPAVGECLAYALAAAERYGVWGATTPAERRALRGAT